MPSLITFAQLFALGVGLQVHAAPLEANVQAHYVVESASNLGTVDGKALVPMEWLGRVFENGPNVTITGPSLTHIVDKIVQLNPDYKFADGTPAVEAIKRAAEIPFYSGSMGEPVALSLTRRDNRNCGMTSSSDNSNYPCVSHIQRNLSGHLISIANHLSVHGM
jgi:hypothetical protein